MEVDTLLTSATPTSGSTVTSTKQLIFRIASVVCAGLDERMDWMAGDQRPTLLPNPPKP